MPEISLASLRTELRTFTDRGPQITFGSVFFVHSSGSDSAGNGLEPNTPYATLAYAVSQCAPNNGDVIYVLEGHAETLTAAGQLQFDVAGVTVLGCGRGTVRPTFTLGTATTADVDIDAANVEIQNLRFVSGINSLAVMLDVNAANFRCGNCDFVTGSATECVNFVNLATTVDDFHFFDCYFFQPTDPDGTDDAAATGCFYFVDSENIFIERCRFVGAFESAIFHNKTTLCQGLWIKDCYGEQQLLSAQTIVLVDASEGGMVNCHFLQQVGADVAEGTFMTIAATTPFGFHNCSWMNDNGGGGNQALPGVTLIPT